MTQNEAIQRAREIALAQGWTWREPVRAKLRKSNLLDRLFGKPVATWDVQSNIHIMGQNVRVILNDETGECLGKWFAPR